LKLLNPTERLKTWVMWAAAAAGLSDWISKLKSQIREELFYF